MTNATPKDPLRNPSECPAPRPFGPSFGARHVSRSLAESLLRKPFGTCPTERPPSQPFRSMPRVPKASPEAPPKAPPFEATFGLTYGESHVFRLPIAGRIFPDVALAHHLSRVPEPSNPIRDTTREPPATPRVPRHSR